MQSPSDLQLPRYILVGAGVSKSCGWLLGHAVSAGSLRSRCRAARTICSPLLVCFFPESLGGDGCILNEVLLLLLLSAWDGAVRGEINPH